LAMIGCYEQVKDFTNENAGTSEWCIAQKDGKRYFIKKFQKPVYPSKDLGLSEAKYEARVKRFHATKKKYEHMYNALRANNHSGLLVVPQEVISYQFHLCTVAEQIAANVEPEEVHRLSEWQRLVLMRSMTLALMNVHAAGVIHGDMKPDNFLITQNAENGVCLLRLIDFDSSYWASSPPESAEEIGGDMAYWAPEILAKFTDESIVLDKAVDVFALGLILHYLWMGALPKKPEGKTIGECLLAGGEVILDESLPLVLNRLISGLIARDPEKRFSCQNAYDVLGVQLENYPRTIVKLVKDEAKAAAARVEVRFRDTEGNTLETIPLTLEPGTSVTVNAKQIEGYEVAGVDRVRLTVNEKGEPSTSAVTFVYQRKKSRQGLIVLLTALGVILLWLLLLCMSEIF